ncbi:MAG: exosortase/archaeosortase family protein [Armatimonadota bacterium]|nr:exosortase/archaeosortase family protein [Armatimonadota bacterium]MDW8104388.1 exosortase/archaeosortase family protein [Armatimonadota bacterium]
MDAEMTVQQRVAPSIDRRQVVQLLAVAALFVFFFMPSLAFLVERWSQSEEFSHGFLVPLVSLFLLWRKREALRQTPLQVCWWGLPVLGLGLLMQVASDWASVSFLKALAVPVALGGLAWYLVGTRMMRVALFPYLFLYFAVPWPDFAIEVLSVPLQHFSAAASTMLLGLLGVPIERDGVHMWTPRFDVEVAVPCSGIRSMVAILGIAALVGYLTQGKLWGKGVVFLAGIPITMFANVLRIAAIVMMGHYINKEFAMTFFHDYSSPFLFFISALSLLGVKKLVEKVE